jgi:hypothetical protein
MLEAYINSSSIGGAVGTTLGLNVEDIAANSNSSVSGTGGSEIEEFSNTNASGVSVAGTTNGTYTIDQNAVVVVDQAPGNQTFTGAAATNFAVFGASSNVTYSVTNGQGSVFAAGGSDSINVFSAGTSSNLSLYSAGNDTVNLNGDGADTVTSLGNATTTIFIGAGTATVSATGSSSAQVVFNLNAGGNVDFVNASTQAVTVFSGTYTVPGAGGTVVDEFVTNHVTAFGGAGGGVFVGGTGGDNKLTEGSGLATLVGGGNGDTLTAAANASTVSSSSFNELFTGQGTETLLATAGSSNNAFNIGLNDVGVGDVTAAGIASSAGSGSNIFEIGSTTSETLTGSQAAGAANIYSFFGDFDAGGSSVTITDFTAANSFILLENSNGSASSDTVNFIGAEQGNANNTAIGLSDGTTIILKGVNFSTSPVAASTLSSGAIFIN